MDLDTLEQFLLLAQHPSKGRFSVSGLHIQYGLAGAILLEMTKMEVLSLSDEKVQLKKGLKFDHPIFKTCSDLIYQSKKDRKIRYWINKFARQSKKTKWFVIHSLVKKRLLRIEERKFLGLIPYKKTYLIESKTRDTLIQQLKSSILSGQNIKQEDLMTLGLVEACKMHKLFSNDKQELKSIQKSLKKVIKDSPIASTVNQTIIEVQAAILTAIIASTVVTSTAGGQ